MDSMIPVLPLTLVTSQAGDEVEEDEEDDWRVEQSLYAQRQFQTDFNTFEDSEEVAKMSWRPTGIPSKQILL